MERIKPKSVTSTLIMLQVADWLIDRNRHSPNCSCKDLQTARKETILTLGCNRTRHDSAGEGSCHGNLACDSPLSMFEVRGKRCRDGAMASHSSGEENSTTAIPANFGNDIDIAHCEILRNPQQ